MREIKFRGYSRTKKHWIYGLPEYFMDKIHAIQTKQRTAIQIDNTTLGQYTGLKDKNGVEIYEGDIVRTELGDIQDIRWVSQKFDGDFIVTFIAFSRKAPHAMGISETDEVIGNIHENPELLEVNND